MRMSLGRKPGFVPMPNSTVDDAASLDFMAMALLLIFLRHQDGWDMTLARIGRKYGYAEDAMAGAMGALQVARYVIKIRKMLVKGTKRPNEWVTEIIAYDTPATDEEVAAALALMRRDPNVRTVQVIPPTQTAIARAAKRTAKLATLATKTPKATLDPIPRLGGFPGLG